MVSTKGRYALRVLLDIAESIDHTEVSPKNYVSLNDVAIRQEISMKYLEAIISSLAKAGLVESKRGKSGGYRLAVLPAECTVGQVIAAAEGDISPVACPDCNGASCPRADTCKTVVLWKNLDHLISDYLYKITLQDLLDGSLSPLVLE